MPSSRFGANFSLAANSVETISSAGFANAHIVGTSVIDVLDFSGITLNNIASIDGGSGADIITGSSGADTIYGGGGSDTLAGGAGADIFYYGAVSDSTGGTYDKLTDFTIGTDTLDLTGTHDVFLATKTTGALNSGGSFNNNLAVAMTGLTANAAEYFTPTTGTLAGHTFLIVDGNGAAGYQAGADWVFEIMGAPPVTPGAVDFIV